MLMQALSTAATWFVTRRALLAFGLAALVACAGVATGGADPLPSWADGEAKQTILKFVDEVTREGTPAFVPAPERIAVFDNDGTLWSEQPLYFQFLFMIEQVKAAAPNHPEWKDNPVFKALAANDLAGALALGEKALLELLVAGNSGMTDETYDKSVREWLASARHPTLKRPYTELVYQPQLELLKYLRAKGFKTFIVSGGSVEFMRPWTERVYGIPPEQVVGTQWAMKPEVQDGNPILRREPHIDFLDDGPGKPLGIYRHIGRRPILAFGNSDGDLQMLQYTTAGPGARLALIVHHDDATREFAYDRQSKVGKLDRALDEAGGRRWTVVSMKRDWLQVFPPQRSGAP
jgi:phosphoglycolate phosphatase-like HAD superfamily hydrolase